MIIKATHERLELFKLKAETKGSRRGFSTGFLDVDNFMLLAKTYLLICTGTGGSGKSELLDAIALNTSIIHNWKWAFYSPENYPISEHLKKYVERLLGKGLWQITKSEIDEALIVLDNNFSWLNPPDNKYDVNSLLEYFLQIKMDTGLDAYIIDPWNEVDHSSQGGARDDQYIGTTLTKIRKFNRKHDLLGCIVIHPKGMMKDHKTGKYPVPRLEDCHGGAMWKNKADYGLCCHRHDMTKDIATIYFQKIKFKHQGQVGVIDLNYEKSSGRFKGIDDDEFLLPDDVPAPF